MINPFTDVNITPGYSSGFQFDWNVDPVFPDPLPWAFTIQVAQSPTGDWKDYSPVICNLFSWHGLPQFKVNKSAVLYFRIILNTHCGTYISDVVNPYGDLTRKEFLIARDIMRREVLHCSQLAGVPEKIMLRSIWGIPCRACTDPVTGRVRDSNCRVCMGTGKANPYHGPYDMWMLFSSDSNHQMSDSKEAGNTEHKIFSARAIGNPVMRHNDVVIDSRTDKRYYVVSASVISEIRRIPVIQNLTLSEAALSDPIYKLEINNVN